MNKHRSFTSLLACFTLLLGLFITNQPSNAEVVTFTSGSSNGASLASNDGPDRFKNRKDKLSKSVTSTSGGSVIRDRARVVAKRANIKIGTEARGSTGLEGDGIFTETNSNGYFQGIATFRASKRAPKNTDGIRQVDNFELTIGLNGLLSCLIGDPDVDNTGQAVASAEYFVSTINRRNGNVVEDFGRAVQDGLSGTPVAASGGLASIGTSTGVNKTRFKGNTTINLGTLQDGDVLDFFFSGNSFVSWGPELFVSECNSDFFNTNTFKIAKRTRKREGRLRVDNAGKVINVVIQDPDQIPSSGDEVILLNDEDVASIVANSITLRVVGAFGTVIDDITLGAVGDANADGIADVALESGQLPFAVLNQSGIITGLVNLEGQNQLFSAIIDLASPSN